MNIEKILENSGIVPAVPQKSRNNESKSSLELFLGCPKAYYDKYVVKNKAWGKGNPRGNAGKGLHTAMEKALNGYLLTGDFSLEIGEIVREMVRAGADSHIILDLSYMADKAEDFITPHLHPVDNIQGIELDLSADDIGIRAIIDYLAIVGNVATVIDHKTQQNTPTEKELENNLQTWTNACVIFENFPNVDTVEMKYLYYRWTAVRSVAVTREDYQRRIRPSLVSMAAEARQMPSCAEPEARACGSCSYCPLLNDCADASDDNTVGTLSVIAHTASERAMIAKRELKKNLDDLHNPGYSSTWAIEETTSYKVEGDSLIGYVQAIIDNGLDPVVYLNVDKKSAENALENEHLKDFVEVKKGSTMKLLKGNIEKFIAQAKTGNLEAKRRKTPVPDMPSDDFVADVVTAVNNKVEYVGDIKQDWLNAVVADGAPTEDRQEDNPACITINPEESSIAGAFAEYVQSATVNFASSTLQPVPESPEVIVNASNVASKEVGSGHNFRNCTLCNRPLSKADWIEMQRSMGIAEEKIQSAQRIHACDCDKPMGKKTERNAKSILGLADEEFIQWAKDNFGTLVPSNRMIRKRIKELVPGADI